MLLAGLFHTYAWCFLVLLLLTGKPWKLRTFLVVAVTIFIMLTFNDSISALLEYGDTIGKGASEEAVFSGEGMSLFRVAVYSIVPVASLMFRRILEPQMERKHYIMLHMSIVSFNDTVMSSVVEPPLTSVSPHLDIMAATAVHLVMQRASTPAHRPERRYPQKIVIPPALVRRSSTAPYIEKE